MAVVLFVLFIVVPIVELAIIIQVGQVVGVGWTLFALIGVSVVGAAVVRREGFRAWQRFRDALAETRMPAAEVIDGALLLLAGALMLTPGFLTDAVGLLLVIPFTRGAINRGIRSRVRGTFGLGPARNGRDRPRGPGERSPGAEVLDVDVIDVERTRPPDPRAPRRHGGPDGPEPR